MTDCISLALLVSFYHSSTAIILRGGARSVGGKLGGTARQHTRTPITCCSTVVVALLALAVLTACGQTPPASQSTLRIGILRLQGDLPYFIMQEQGFAAQHGIKLEETVYRSGFAIIEAMAAGTVDVGLDVGTVPLLAAAEIGLVPHAAVPVGASYFSDPEHPLCALLVAPAVRHWHDLIGQQIAINGKNTLSAAAIQGRLTQEGVHGTTFVDMSLTDMGLAVAGGNVAAAVMWEPWLTQSLLRGDGTVLGYIIGGPPFEQMEISMSVFRAEVYQHHRQVVKAFLRAKLQAMAWIARHPDKARALLGRRLNLTQEVTRRVQWPRWSSDGRHDPALLERMQPLLLEIGLLKAPIPVRHLTDETLLQEVLAEKR